LTPFWHGTTLLCSRPDAGCFGEGSPTNIKPTAVKYMPSEEEYAMITVGMNYHTLPGKQVDFEQKFAAVIEALKAAEGHSVSNLWKDVADDASYLITSEWSDDGAFQDFIQSDAFREVTNWGKEQILSDRPRHKIYKH
jgi:heme-degrading monooxygenase HmoA